MIKNCAFCQISSNPSSEKERIFFEDPNFIGMYVLHPESKGHFIIFTKKHYSSIFEMKSEDGAELFNVALERAKLIKNPFTLKMNNNVYLLDNDPMHVGHIHIHIIPKYAD